MVVPTTRSIPVMALRLRPDRSGGANVEAAWDVTKGNAALSIAVLDTGYVDHGDLSPRIVGGYDLVSLDRRGRTKFATSPRPTAPPMTGAAATRTPTIRGLITAAEDAERPTAAGTGLRRLQQFVARHTWEGRSGP